MITSMSLNSFATVLLYVGKIKGSYFKSYYYAVDIFKKDQWVRQKIKSCYNG